MLECPEWVNVIIKNFRPKDAAWDSLEAPDAAVKTQAHNHPKFVGIAAARASISSSASGVELAEYPSSKSSVKQHVEQPVAPARHTRCTPLLTAEPAADAALFEDPQIVERTLDPRVPFMHTGFATCIALYVT